LSKAGPDDGDDVLTPYGGQDKKMLSIVRNLFDKRVYWFVSTIIWNVCCCFEAAIFYFVKQKTDEERLAYDVWCATGLVESLIERVMQSCTHEFMRKVGLGRLEVSHGGGTIAIGQYLRFTYLLHLQISLTAETVWQFRNWFLPWPLLTINTVRSLFESPSKSEAAVNPFKRTSQLSNFIIQCSAN
jgi:hypothetical protein